MAGVSQTPKPRRSRPPHNPGVRELIADKRKWSSPPARESGISGYQGWHERGYLPHRDESGLTQLVTFHLVDSYPESLRSEWKALHEIENDLTRRKQLEAYLDKGKGQCHLRELQIGGLVDGALRYYHGKRYDLLAWVVMPNHVHALFKANTPLGKIIADFKEYTAREANKLLFRRGQFWAEDYWDTYMRNGQHELKARLYIENNPTKAKLILDPKAWPWSSARFRDENGILHL